MSETILVTGATGTVGSEVVKQLSRDAPSYNIKAGIHSIENAKRFNNMTELKLYRLTMTNKKDLNLHSKV
jgi:uncharacterized protein YbjT (DUF2867 family)